MKPTTRYLNWQGETIGKGGFEFCNTLGCEVTISQITPEGVERKCKVRFDNTHLANFADLTGD